MFCKKCGANLGKGVLFCSSCGSSLAKDSDNESKEAGKRAVKLVKRRLEPMIKRFGWRLAIVAVVVLMGAGLAVGVWRLGKITRVPEQEVTKTLSADVDNEVKLDEVTFSLPKDSINDAATVEVSRVAAKELPELPEESKPVGNAYEISTSANIKDDKPAYVTLAYDASDLPDGADEKHIYLAHYDGKEWQPVPGATIDTEAKTVTAAVSDFSIFTLLFNPLLAVTQSDVIEGVERFADLPADIKQDLDQIYSQSSIKSGLRWQVSPITQLASQTLIAANFINQVAGGAIAAVEGGQDMVTDWLVEQIALKAAEVALTETAGEAGATVTLVLYDTSSLGKEIYKEGFSAIKSTPILQAKAVAWVLAREMEYINAHIGEGYAKIAKLNLLSNEPLVIYVISIHGENKQTGLMDKGIKFYYNQDIGVSSGAYVNYANAVVGTELQSVEVETPAADKTEEEGGGVSPTAAPKETVKPSPTPTKQSSASGSCEKVDLTKNYKTYYIHDAQFPCSNFARSVSSDKYSIRCPQAVSRWREHYVREIDTKGATSLKVRAQLGLLDHARFFMESGGVGVKYDDYVDLIFMSSNPNTTLAKECNTTYTESTGSQCAVLNSQSGVLGHCGVPMWKASRSCDFSIKTSGLSKVYAVLRVADAWPADPEGSLSNLEICY